MPDSPSLLQARRNEKNSVGATKFETWLARSLGVSTLRS